MRYSIFIDPCDVFKVVVAEVLEIAPFSDPLIAIYNKPFHLTCSTSGNYEDLIWYRSNHPEKCSPTDRTQLNSTVTERSEVDGVKVTRRDLVINRTTFDDQGCYYCSALHKDGGGYMVEKAARTIWINVVDSKYGTGIIISQFSLKPLGR